MQVKILPDCIKELDKDFMNLSFIGCKMLLFIFLKLFYTFVYLPPPDVDGEAALAGPALLQNGQRHRCRCKSFSKGKT